MKQKEKCGMDNRIKLPQYTIQPQCGWCSGGPLPAGGDSTVAENWLSYKTLPGNHPWHERVHELYWAPVQFSFVLHTAGLATQSSSNESGLRSFLSSQGEAEKVLSGVLTHDNSLWQGLFWGKMVIKSEAKRTFSGISGFLPGWGDLKIPQAPSPCSVPTLSLQYPLMNNRMKGCHWIPLSNRGKVQVTISECASFSCLSSIK